MQRLIYDGSLFAGISCRACRKLLLLFSHSVVSDFLQPHGLQHARLPCPSLTPRICSNSCPLSQWCHPTISSSLAFSCPQSFPALRVFSNESLQEMAKVSEFQLQHQPFQWIFRLLSFRIDWFDLHAVQGTRKSVLQHHNSKASILWCSAFFMVQLSHLYMMWKNHSSDYMDLCWQSDVSAFEYTV